MELPEEGLTVWICRIFGDNSPINVLTEYPAICKTAGSRCLLDKKPCDARKAVLSWAKEE